MEIMIAIVILALLTAFAMPQYRKAVQKTRERDAAAQLLSIRAANFLYRSQAGNYLPAGGANDLDYMNGGLGLRIMANDLTYVYASATPNTFTATAGWIDPDGNIIFRLRINQTSVSLVPPVNPCCSAGACLSYQNC